MGYNPLTIRQKEVLKLLADGKTGKEAGIDLGIAEQTIKNTLESLRQKLGTRNTLQTVALALREGWIK